MATRMQQRRGTASQWISTNSGNGPILAAGEIGFESDTNKFKVGDGINHWVDLTYFTDADSITAALNSIIDGAPAALNTLNELAAALGDDANFLASLATQTYVDTAVSNSAFDASLAAGAGLDWNATTDQFDIDGSVATESYVDTAIDAHANDTTSIHGIADTADLATKTYADNSSSGAVSTHSADTTSVHGIADTADLATKGYAETQVSTHNADTTSVHGIADTTVLVTATGLSTAISDHNSDTTNVHGIIDTAELATKSYADGAVSTHSSDTTSVHGIADTTVLVTTTDLSTAVSDHNSDTTSVHGITDTSALATKTYADDAVSTHTLDTTNVHGIADTADLATKSYADSAVSTHNSDTTNVHGISDTSILVTTTGAATLTNKTLESPTFTGTVTLPNNTISQAMMGDDSVGTNEIGGLSVTNEKLAGSIGWDKLAISSTVSSTELGYVDGVTSAIQTQLDDKLSKTGGTMTGALTLSGAPSSDLHAATKLYVDNVTSGINFHQAAHVATTENLSAGYSNGTGGVGATLMASANGAWTTLDGHSSFTQYDRILVKDQTDSKQNGIYVLSDLGGSTSKWVLTRASDADNNPTGEMKNGDFILVLNGTTNSGYGFVNSSTANPIAIGTDNITFVPFNAAKTVVAGDGLAELIPGTLSIASGGVTSTMIANGAIVDADINASAAIAQSKISGLTTALSAKAPIDAPTFTNLVTVSASGVAFTDGTQTKQGVPSQTYIYGATNSNAITTDTTLSNLAYRDTLVEVSSATAITITIPLDSTTNFPIGTSIDLLQVNTGQVTIAGAGGVTVNATPGLKLRTTWSSATLFKRAANTWVVYGDLTA